MKKLLVIALSTLAIFGVLSAIDAIAAPYYPAQGGTGTGTIPQSGEILIGNASGTYTPAYIVCSGNCTTATSSGGFTINVTGGGGSSSTVLYAGPYIMLTASGTNGYTISNIGVLSLTSSSDIGVSNATGTAISLTFLNPKGFTTTTIQSVLNTLSATGLATYNSSTGVFSVSSSSLNLGSASHYSFSDFLASSTLYVSSFNTRTGAVTLTSGDVTTALGFTPLSTTTGNWAGTWQGVNSSTFYLASNPSGFISGNQTITIVATGDATGTASGATSITHNLTITGLQGKALPSLATGTLQYTGGAWTFNNNTYLLSGINVTTTAPLGGGGPLTSAGLTLTCATCLTGNQTITLTGAVTGSGTTSIATAYTTSTLYGFFSATSPIVYNASTGQFSWTNSNNYISSISINGNSGTSFNIVAGPGVTSTVSGTTTTLSLNLSTGCTGNNFVQTISATGTITCAVPSGGASSTNVYGVSPIVVTQVGVNATTSCPTCIATNSGNWAGTWQLKNPSDFLASNTIYLATNTGNWAGTWKNLNTTDFLSSSTVYLANNLGNWAGTWQGVNSTTFYLATNPSGYITSTPAYLLSINGDTTQAQLITVSGILSSSTATKKTTIGLSTSTLNTNVAALGYITSTPAGTVYLASTTPWTLGGLVIASTTGSVTTESTSTLYTALGSPLLAAITSINGDTTAAQRITGSGCITTSTTGGVTTIGSTCLIANQSITWTGSGDATGTASGATSLTPTLHVVAIQGKAVSSTAPTDQQYLKFVNANSDWEPSTLPAFLSNISTTINTAGPLGGGGSLANNGILNLTCTGCLTANQSITFTESGDVTSTASGATSLTPTAHVVAIQGYAVTSSAPTTGDVLQWSGSQWLHNPTSSLGISGGGGVTSANSITGAVIIAGGSGITVASSSQTITITANASASGTINNAVANQVAYYVATSTVAGTSTLAFTPGGTNATSTLQLGTSSSPGVISSIDYTNSSTPYFYYWRGGMPFFDTMSPP